MSFFVYKLKNTLRFLQHYYVDATDPEGRIAKLSFRTALACIVSVLLFQWIGSPFLSTWAGFATFAFVQNDTYSSGLPRFLFLLSVIFFFTGLACVSMILSYHSQVWFMVSIPFVIFILAYGSCLGLSYFSAAGWGMFLYIMAGSNLLKSTDVLPIFFVFLVCGIISLSICFLLFPHSHTMQLSLNYRRILAKLCFILEVSQQPRTTSLLKLNVQLDHLLLLQENKTNDVSRKKTIIDKKELLLIDIGKQIYQVCLITRSIIVLWQFLLKIYPEIKNENHLQTISFTHEIIDTLLTQFKTTAIPDFSAIHDRMAHDRAQLTLIRQREIEQPDPNFSAFLDYSRFFYLHMTLINLLENMSLHVSQWQKKT